MTEWWNRYLSLDLLGGDIFFTGDDLEDMIEISYPDGMVIDVGKYDIDGIYNITVVASNDEVGWRSPLAVISISDKNKLFDRIQETINIFRAN